jgi:murein DD-endopeptidase MepM/ murein hydrolase activator NlpD
MVHWMRERTRSFWRGAIAVTVVLVTALPVMGSAPRLPRPASATPHRLSTAASTSRPAPAAAPAAMLDRIQSQLAWRRRRLAEVVREERWALAQLSGAQERLERATAHLNQTTAALTGTEHAVASATQTLQTVTTRLSHHETVMGARVRAFYEQGPLGYADVILGATDFRDFITRSYLIARIIDNDLALYHQVAAEHQQQEDVRASLVSHQEQLSAEQARWITDKAETARLAVERRQLVDRVRTERASQEAAIRELEAESARIREIIRAAGGRHVGPILTLRSGLLWPITGRVSSGYGWRIHPIFHTREFHTGIDIAAPYSAPIAAVLDGTVIFSGWMRGYGMLVILDHGNGLSTTYSHISASLVHVGDHVQRGAIIARIGSTGWSTGPHLFFEVREDGQPVDPLGG